MQSDTSTTESNRERTAQRYLREMGYDFLTHVRDLPGKPDIFIPAKRLVVQIFGCFYHCHSGCPRCKTPPRHQDFWERKFQRIQERDRHASQALMRRAYRQLVIWECGLDYGLANRLRPAMQDFIEGTEFLGELGSRELLALPVPVSGSADE